MNLQPLRFIVVMCISLALLFSFASISPAQTVTTVYNFTGKNGSANPLYGTLAQGRNAELYGTTYQSTGGQGSIFAFASTGVGSTPFSFNGTNASNPVGGLTLATDGTFYGTTAHGGTQDNGVLFEVTPSGILFLHELGGESDGALPYAAPVQASDGSLYGTTNGSSILSGSTIYKYTPASGVFTTIYQFNGDAEGQSIFAPLIQGTDGNLYGTANGGGAYGSGTIFKLNTSGTLLFDYSFPCCGTGGLGPVGPLVQASDGNFYGTTSFGGYGRGYGVIFKMDRNDTVSVLYEFKGPPNDGRGPSAGLTQATDGKLYGTTTAGGLSDSGTLFQITTGGTYKLLYSFLNEAGTSPQAAPAQHTNGILYGTTELGGRFGFGTIYSLDMGLGPFVTFVRPTGRVGKSVQILGQALTGTTSVTFNGVAAAKFTVISDTYMTAVVPAGATTGVVVVATPAGNLTSNVSFRISK